MSDTEHFLIIAAGLLRRDSKENTIYTSVAEAEHELASADSLIRAKAVKTLREIYQRLKSTTDESYTTCEINTILCEHGTRRAADEIENAGIPWKLQGLSVIFKVIELGQAGDIQNEFFVPYQKLLNRAINALPWNDQGVYNQIQAVIARREAKEAGTKVIDEIEDDEYDNEEDEWDEDLKEPVAATVKKVTLRLGFPRLFSVGENQAMEELDLDVESGGSVNKSIIMVLCGDNQVAVHQKLMSRWQKELEAETGARYEAVEEGADEDADTDMIDVTLPSRPKTALATRPSKSA